MHSRLCGASRLAASYELKVRTQHRGRHLKVNDAVSNSDCITLNDWIVVNIELERAWKEAVFAQFKTLLLYLLWGRLIEESLEKHESGQAVS